MKTNRELKEIGLNSFFKKVVVVKHIDENKGYVIATTGTLVDFDEGGEDEEGNRKEGFIALASGTDYDRIALSSVRKVFLKEDEK